jgi:hypothetical protein
MTECKKSKIAKLEINTCDSDFSSFSIFSQLLSGYSICSIRLDRATRAECDIFGDPV